MVERQFHANADECAEEIASQVDKTDEDEVNRKQRLDVVECLLLLIELFFFACFACDNCGRLLTHCAKKSLLLSPPLRFPNCVWCDSFFGFVRSALLSSPVWRVLTLVCVRQAVAMCSHTFSFLTPP